MKRYAIFIVVVVVGIVAWFVFQGRSEQPSSVTHKTQPPPTGRADGAAAYAGEVIETMNSGGYTYVHVNTGREKIWAAGPTTTVKVGDKVTLPTGMQMKDFKSETLNRTFETIYFVPAINAGGGTAQMPPGHPQVPQGRPEVPSTTADLENMNFSGLDVPDSGKRIATLYAEKAGLAGKDVIVRGKVVKFTPNVMGKNWIHLRDGTGTEGTNDLTVTTNTTVKVGDVVVARGVLSVDKDFGAGYAYNIIVEDAMVAVE